LFCGDVLALDFDAAPQKKWGKLRGKNEKKKKKEEVNI
jgi:hypothetical protein